MSIEAMPGGGVMFAGKEAVSIFRLITLKHALKMECMGLRVSRISAYAAIKREFGLKGSKQRVLDQFVPLADRLIEEARARDAQS